MASPARKHDKKFAYTFRVTLHAETERDAIVRLRRILKALIRRYSVRCTGVVPGEK